MPLSQTEENYLKTMYTLANDNNELNVSELSKRLSVSTPTANSMVKNLHDKNLVIYEKYKPIILSKTGLIQAAYIVRKHRLTEMYLVEKMGFGWEFVHEIAEQMEHIQSPLFFDKMDELLGYPTVDPHGSPIPDRQGKVIEPNYKQLSDCEKGDVVEFCALKQSGIEFLNFLNSRELSLGLLLTVKRIESFDKSMVIAYENHPLETFSFSVCKQLLVLKIE